MEVVDSIRILHEGSMKAVSVSVKVVDYTWNNHAGTGCYDVAVLYLLALDIC